MIHVSKVLRPPVANRPVYAGARVGLCLRRSSLLWLSLLLSGCGNESSREIPLPESPPRLSIRLQSSAFAEGERIPRRHTCEGEDSSPPLRWSGIPSAADSLAIVVEDPDSPQGTWSHWVLFDLARDAVELPEGVPPEPRVPSVDGQKDLHQGHNDFGKTGYGGPCPPSGTHHYVFRIFALDADAKLDAVSNRSQLLSAIRGHVLAEGRLTGVYSKE